VFRVRCCTVLLEGVKVKLPPLCIKVIVLASFVAAAVKLQHFVISEPDEVHHRKGATVST